MALRNLLLASISLKGNNFIEKIKHLPQVRFMKVSKENRGALVKTIINEITLKSIKGHSILLKLQPRCLM